MAAAEYRTCGACKRESNNKKWDCPVRMADGRLFTDYRPRCDIQLEQRLSPGLGSHEYRQFLIHEAAAIAQKYRDDAFGRAYCGPCATPYDIGTMLPETDVFVCDKVSCARRRTPASATTGYGLGTGRDYGTLPENKEARDRFLEQQAMWQRELQREANCCVPRANLWMQSQGMNATSTSQPSSRWAVPGGGRPVAVGDASVRVA